MKVLVFFCFLFELSLFDASTVRYDNYKVYRLLPTTHDELQRLHDLEKSNLKMKFWKVSTGKMIPTDILVPPHKTEQVENILKTMKIRHGIMIDNLQSLIDENRRKAGVHHEMNWRNYNNLTEINNWMVELTKKYPENVQSVVGGRSYEGRDINGVKLTFKTGNKAVFIEGGIHAREWISPAVVTYILNEFLTSKNGDVRNVAESYDWYFFPSVNPDGFEYTHTTDRLWRMTRQPHGICIGADPNRNWGYHWNEGGTSNSSCEETYPGPFPFSEPETKSLSKFITSIHENLIGYISFHSYSQLLLIPYGYSNNHIENYEELMKIGKKAIDSLAQRYGTKFVVGNMAETIYVASGVSPDWVKGNFKTPITYTYELRDTGKHGFILPPEQIILTAEETFDSLVTMMSEAKTFGYV